MRIPEKDVLALSRTFRLAIPAPLQVITTTIMDQEELNQKAVVSPRCSLKSWSLTVITSLN
jgi:hypothetical protein